MYSNIGFRSYSPAGPFCWIQNHRQRLKKASCDLAVSDELPVTFESSWREFLSDEICDGGGGYIALHCSWRDRKEEPL